MRSEELLVKQEKRHADRIHDGRSKNIAYVCIIKESRLGYGLDGPTLVFTQPSLQRVPGYFLENKATGV